MAIKPKNDTLDILVKGPSKSANTNFTSELKANLQKQHFAVYDIESVRLLHYFRSVKTLNCNHGKFV